MKQANYEQLHKQTINRKERYIEEAIAQREYYNDQIQLRKRMKNLLISAINQENEMIDFLQDWVSLVFFFDIMSSLREHIQQRRTRVDNIERVSLSNKTLATMSEYIYKNKKFMKSKGPTFELRTCVQATL